MPGLEGNDSLLNKSIISGRTKYFIFY